MRPSMRVKSGFYVGKLPKALRATHEGRCLLCPKCVHGIDGGGATSGNDGRDQA